jgi:hypothetical protein
MTPTEHRRGVQSFPSALPAMFGVNRRSTDEEPSERAVCERKRCTNRAAEDEMGAEVSMRKTLKELLQAQVLFPPQFLAVEAQVHAFGIDYERAYAESEGRVLHLVLLALGVPLPEIIKSSTSSASEPGWDLASLRRRFPLESLSLMTARGPRIPLIELMERQVQTVVPAGLPAEAKERLAALGTDYERAYWDDEQVALLLLLVFGADVAAWVSWHQEQPRPAPPDDDETLRARWPLHRVLALVSEA